MATALATIGKFAIKKKVGDADQIFGSVTAADVVAAIEQQARSSSPTPDVALLRHVELSSLVVVNLCEAQVAMSGLA